MSNDDRIAPRIEFDATLFIEAGVRANPQDTGDIVICQSRDIPDTGMQLVMDQPVRKGRIVRACLDINRFDPVFVIARVVWQNHNNEAYHHGLMLLESPDSDLGSWRETVAALAA